MSSGNTAFLDTSIQIARIIHSPDTRKLIEERLKAFSFTVTGLVVRQEFKRRLLKDAKYLLDLFEKYGSFGRVQRHVVDVLTPYQARKQRISLQVLTTIIETDSEEDKTDRAVLLLKGLLRDGLYEFEQSVGHVIKTSGCECGARDVQATKQRYDFGTDKCSKTKNCGVAKFLENNKEELRRILSVLDELEGSLTEELKNAAAFIREYLSAPGNVHQLEPCKRVGDLMIALESKGIPAFYTMNGKESQHLCRAMNQTLIVRPPNPVHPEVECERDSGNWEVF